MKQGFVVLILLVLGIACSKKEKFTVQGNIAEGKGSKVILYRMDLDKEIAIDSIELKSSGNFKFTTGRLAEPTFFKLQLGSGSFITLLGDSTENIEIAASLASFAKTYQVKNSSGSQKVQMLKSEITSLRTQVDSLINIYQSLSEDDKQLQLKPLSDEIVESISQYKKRIAGFVMENPRSFASYYALFLTLSDGNMVLNIMDKQDQVYYATIATSLDILYPKSPRVRQLYDLVLKAKSEQRKAQMIEIIANAEGSGLPEIKELDLNGNEIALSSLKGKVVLLSFWASQDKASRRENQLLKPIYQKYKGRGFEVYQVGIERSKVLWESVLVQDEIPWISVSDFKFTESIAAKIYNVQQLPANYLISRDGQIIGKNLFGSQLEDKLKEVL